MKLIAEPTENLLLSEKFKNIKNTENESKIKKYKKTNTIKIQTDDVKIINTQTKTALNQTDLIFDNKLKICLMCQRKYSEFELNKIPTSLFSSNIDENLSNFKRNSNDINIMNEINKDNTNSMNTTMNDENTFENNIQQKYSRQQSYDKKLKSHENYYVENYNDDKNKIDSNFKLKINHQKQDSSQNDSCINLYNYKNSNQKYLADVNYKKEIELPSSSSSISINPLDSKKSKKNFLSYLFNWIQGHNCNHHHYRHHQYHYHNNYENNNHNSKIIGAGDGDLIEENPSSVPTSNSNF